MTSDPDKPYESLPQYVRLDDWLRFRLDRLCEQCDKTQYWNAMRLLTEINEELLNRQQEIHRKENRP